MIAVSVRPKREVVSKEAFWEKRVMISPPDGGDETRRQKLNDAEDDTGRVYSFEQSVESSS